jgi:hypothetical protein
VKCERWRRLSRRKWAGAAGDWQAYSAALREMKWAALEAWGVREREGAA